MKKVILLGSMILVLATGCNKPATSSSNKPASSNTINTDSNTTATQSSIPPTFGTSSIVWKTYTNTQYGFQIQYPIVYYKAQVKVLDNSGKLGSKDISFEYFDPNSNQYVGSFDVFVYPNTSGLTLDQWFETNVDINSDMKKAGIYQISNITDGQELDLEGVTQSYLSEPNTKPITSQVYFMPSSKQNVFSVDYSKNPDDLSGPAFDVGSRGNGFKFIQ
jgi:hypothetical protein